MTAYNRKEIIKELEATRTAFSELVKSVPDSEWENRSAGSAWSKKEELWHIAWGSQFILDLIKNGRRCIGFPFIPALLFDNINIFYTKLRARNASRELIIKRYQNTLDAAIVILNVCTNIELEKQVKVFGERQSIAELFKGIPHHLEEHKARIKS